MYSINNPPSRQTMAFSLTIPLVLLGLTWLLVSIIRTHVIRQKMPPGPRGIPLLGNVFQMPKELPWLRFADFGKKYGVHLQPELTFAPFSKFLMTLKDLLFLSMLLVNM
jgi:hypothetical protein